jgi:ribonuclease-3
VSSLSNSSSSQSTDNEHDEKKSSSKKKLTDDDLEEFDDIRSMEINRKMNHPERLHANLSFNEPDQTNEGPLCKCKLKNTTFGTRHQIYYGETKITQCDRFRNNADKLHHYRLTITPFRNFAVKIPTLITYDKHDYMFEGETASMFRTIYTQSKLSVQMCHVTYICLGYSLFAHEPLVTMPDCIVVIYNHEYRLNVVSEQMVDNFTVDELELIKDFLFDEILELYDIKWKGFGITDGCNSVHIMPRFCRTLPYNGTYII